MKLISIRGFFRKRLEMQVPVGSVSGRPAATDELADAGKKLATALHLIAQRFSVDEGARTRIAQNVAELASRQAEVYGDGDGAQKLSSKIRRCRILGRANEERHTVSATDAPIRECLREPPDPRVPPGIGPAPVLIDQGYVLGITLGALPQQRSDVHDLPTG